MTVQELAGHGERILLVEDLKSQQEIAKVMLGKLNYTVAAVSSGEEALSYLETHEIDLLVLDMKLEFGIDGLETYQRVLELYPEQKAIVASAYSALGKVSEIQALGAGAHVQKPYTLEQLGTAVKNELASTRA